MKLDDMFGFTGLIITFVMVFGGFMLAGGKLPVIFGALHFELMIIGGAAVGAYILSNDTSTLRHTPKGVRRAFLGPRWTAQDHQDLLCLMYELLRFARNSPIILEEHIEDPAASSVFQRYPRILADKGAVGLIVDTMRSASLNYDDPFQVEDMLTKRINLMREEGMQVANALQHTADALPALGIVAAVLGIIKTMAAIDQPPEILGKMIGGALVGTFLGVFLAYGIVGPLATRLGQVMRRDEAFYDVIKAVLVAGMHDHNTSLCLEVGRQASPELLRPSYGDLEMSLRELKAAP